MLTLLSAMAGNARAQCPDGTPPPCGPQWGRPRGASRASVAVLYFDNLSGDTADVYLVEGFTEELIVRLAQVPRLVVASRYAVRRYRGTAEASARLGRALGATNLVSGSVRRSGRRLRVNVELVRAATGSRLWGTQYDRADDDLLSVQEEVASAVATTVAGRLLPTERARLAERPTRDPVAYDHFLRGNYAFGRANRRGVFRAIDEYETAVRLDPTFMAALARSAYAYFRAAGFAREPGQLPRDSLVARGLDAATRALRQDSGLSDAWLAYGNLVLLERPTALPEARAALERAVRLDSTNAEAYHRYGSLLRVFGEDSAELVAYRRALALEPDRAITLHTYAMTLLRLRRYAQALAVWDSAVRADPALLVGYVWRGLARVQTGDLRGARSDAETALRLDSLEGWRGEAVLAMVAARQGDSAAARGHAARLPPRHFLGAMAFAALGDLEQALGVFDSIPGDANRWWMMGMPAYDRLRGTPRFQRLLEASQPPWIAPR